MVRSYRGVWCRTWAGLRGYSPPRSALFTSEGSILAPLYPMGTLQPRD